MKRIFLIVFSLTILFFLSSCSRILDKKISSNVENLLEKYLDMEKLSQEKEETAMSKDYLYLAKYYYYKELNLALENVEKSLQVKENHKAYLLKACILFKLNNIKEAKIAFMQYLEYDPYNEQIKQLLDKIDSKGI